jgi:hypothetical protein
MMIFLAWMFKQTICSRTSNWMSQVWSFGCFSRSVPKQIQQDDSKPNMKHIPVGCLSVRSITCRDTPYCSRTPPSWNPLSRIFHCPRRKVL